MSVDIGLPAFLPGSQINLKPIKDFDSHIGSIQEFKILKYNKRRSNIVLSRRAILEAERSAMREKTLQHLQIGAVMEGTVKNITEYVCSSTWEGSTGSCTSPTCPGAESGTPRSSSGWGTDHHQGPEL